MRLSRTDFFPLLTIVAGGVIGASLSFSFLGSRSDDVPAPEPVVAPSATAELAPKQIDMLEQMKALEEAMRLLERDRMERIEEMGVFIIDSSVRIR